MSLEHENQQPVNHLARLPLEMLAEALSYTTPADILALSRTSRYFCATLVTNLASQFIWRGARKRFRPGPIPDPTPNWTESAYAAFIFDSAQCENCHKTTRRTPFSYALRARLCVSEQCQKAWLSGLIKVAAASPDAHVTIVQSRLPYYEDSTETTDIARTYRTEQWDAAIQEYVAGLQSIDSHSRIQQEFARKAKHLEHIIVWARKLRHWGERFEHLKLKVIAANNEFLKSKAKQEGWESKDFVNAPLYTSIRTLKRTRCELLTDHDYTLLRDQFLEQVAKCREVRVRRAIENSARINREEVRKYWDTLKASTKEPLPSYPEFRRLPMVRILILKNTTEASALDTQKDHVRDELHTNEVTRKHIQQDIDIWLHDKRKKLAEKLGDLYSSLAVPAGLLHPVERTTAWFRCTRCNRVGRALEDMKALTFANVCAHQCLGLPEKDRLQGAWDVDWFEPDQKAIAAAKELLRVCSLQEQSATQISLHAFGCRFLCKSCENPIVMDATSVIGHCKRHETTTLELLAQDQANAIMKTPVERGLFSKLMGFTKSGAKERTQRAFACRHCQKQPLTFDGLRSHVKAKHGVEHMRDEDFSCVQEPRKNASH